MSTYVTRFIEIRKDNKWQLLDWTTKVRNHEDSDFVKPHSVLLNGELVVTENSITDCGLGVRDYLRDVWGYIGTKFKNRGVPADASNELKEAFAEHTKPGESGTSYTYNHSYYTLDEMEKLLERLTDLGWESIEREVKAVKKSELNEKLDKVLENQAAYGETLKNSTIDSVKTYVETTAKNKPRKNTDGKDTNSEDGLIFLHDTYFEVIDDICGVKKEVDLVSSVVNGLLDSSYPSCDIRVTFYFDNI